VVYTLGRPTFCASCEKVSPFSRFASRTLSVASSRRI
jgi:hypothetical protein